MNTPTEPATTMRLPNYETSVEFRPTARGKWRAYTVEQQALMHWRGPNYKVRVVRDRDDRIVERKSEQTLRDYLETQQWYWVSYKGVPLVTAGERVRAAWLRIRQAAEQQRGEG